MNNTVLKKRRESGKGNEKYKVFKWHNAPNLDLSVNMYTRWKKNVLYILIIVTLVRQTGYHDSNTGYNKK